MLLPLLLCSGMVALLTAARPVQLPSGPDFVNSLGMRLIRVEPQAFTMGESAAPLADELLRPLTYPTRDELQQRFPQGDPKRFAVDLNHVRNGDFDERPVHRVRITRPYYIGAFEVTNAQYEQFDPQHRALRGRKGFSRADDEAVVFVSWHEAKKFCEWLSKKEGRPYRLPTEAEWELACRAGSSTAYYTGATLPAAFHKNQRRTSFQQGEKDIVSLKVGQTPPNRWGLFDMHGNVEEWTEDWYGPYESGEQTDPVGRAGGDFKVSRGGSHNTEPYYLRSANRSGNLPEHKQWLVGFRVVAGEMPGTKPLPAVAPAANQVAVKQQPAPARPAGYDPGKPYFKGPRQYVKIAAGSAGPLYAHHNHDAGITEMPNGDLLAIWYTCVEERGREVGVAASRLRYGAEEWEPASPFWDTPDRNDHCPALWHDGRGTLYHFNGLSVAAMWEPLAIVMRTSKDNGATWSKARLIVPEHGYRQMVGEPVFRAKDGSIVFAADADGASALWISRDEGLTWSDPGGNINGIHAGVTQLPDGRLMALGRGANIGGMMPMSISTDMGKTWTASASPFPPIGGGQRLVLLRLNEGALFVASFARDIHNPQPPRRDERGVTRLFAAVSFDDGRTWPARRVITDGKPDHPVRTIDGAPVLMNAGSSEPQGYLAGAQSADGIIHLISSTQHYAFNLAWLKQPAPNADPAPREKALPVAERLAEVTSLTAAPGTSGRWQFLGKSAEPAAGPAGVALRADSDALPRWSNERLNGFGSVDLARGFTVEFTAQVARAAGTRGLDLEVHARAGTINSNHYFITITPDAVHYWYDGAFRPVATGLDNAGGPHTYRIAVRPDTAVQIYRDGNLLGVHAADIRIDWRAPARGSWIEWGAGAAGLEANVSRLAFDLAGPRRPR